MNTEVVSSLKTFACGAAALALTAVFSWSFVESTSVARWNTAQQVGNAAVAIAQTSAAALVD